MMKLLVIEKNIKVQEIFQKIKKKKKITIQI